jgi:membrane-associated phospholipid phosphatase
LVVTLITAAVLKIPLKDPDGFMGPSYVRLPVLGLIFFGVGIVFSVLDRRTLRNPRILIPRVITEVRSTWNLRRVLFSLTGLACFYVCYVCYRNLKSDLPVIREGVPFDRQLAAIDDFLSMGLGVGPALHGILGTGVAAYLLSLVYLAYLPLIPITLGAFLVLVRDLRVGAWYSTTLCLNWLLGVISYFLVPTLGPAFYRPDQFADLPSTGVSALQHSMYGTRMLFMSDPGAGGRIQSIAAFASLHVSVIFALALFMQLTNQRKWLRVITWVYFGLVAVSTLYFGWHYVSDCVAGLLIGWLSVRIGAWGTGSRLRRRGARGLKPTLTPVYAASH